MNSDLLDLDTFIALKRAAPNATPIPFDRAQLAVQSLAKFSKSNQPHKDQHGVKYWTAYLKELTGLAGLEVGQVSSNLFGRAYRRMGLESSRVMDGGLVSWSETQLKILKKYFKA